MPGLSFSGYMQLASFYIAGFPSFFFEETVQRDVLVKFEDAFVYKVPYKHLVLHFVYSVGPYYWPHSSLSREEVVYHLFCNVLGVGVIHTGVLSNVLIVIVLPFEL